MPTTARPALTRHPTAVLPPAPTREGGTPSGIGHRAPAIWVAVEARSHHHGWMAARATPIDAYLAGVPADRRAALQRLRRTIRAIVPTAEECISYGIPAFRADAKVFAGFAATARGCSYFPFSGSTLPALAAELEGYGGTKSSLHFSPEAGLPVALVRKLVRTRRAEIRAKGK